MVSIANDIMKIIETKKMEPPIEYLVIGLPDVGLVLKKYASSSSPINETKKRGGGMMELLC